MRRWGLIEARRRTGTSARRCLSAAAAAAAAASNNPNAGPTAATSGVGAGFATARNTTANTTSTSVFSASRFGERERVAEQYYEKKDWTVEALLEKRRAAREGTDRAKQASVNWVSHDDAVIDAVRRMVDHRVGSMLVADRAEGHGPRKFVGIVTERDYLSKIAVRDLSSRTTKVGDIMTPRKDIVVATLDHTLYECLHLFETGNFRHLPIVNPRPDIGPDEEEVMAVLSQRDLVQEFREYHETSMRYLEAFVEFPIW